MQVLPPRPHVVESHTRPDPAQTPRPSLQNEYHRSPDVSRVRAGGPYSLQLALPNGNQRLSMAEVGRSLPFQPAAPYAGGYRAAMLRQHNMAGGEAYNTAYQALHGPREPFPQQAPTMNSSFFLVQPTPTRPTSIHATSKDPVSSYARRPTTARGFSSNERIAGQHYPSNVVPQLAQHVKALRSSIPARSTIRKLERQRPTSVSYSQTLVSVYG